MRLAAVFLFLVLFLPGISYAQESHFDVQKYLESELKDHVLLLRHFPENNRIEYDQSGNPISQIHTGAWTTSKMQVEDVHVDPNSIELHGPRVFTYFSDKTSKLENGKISESYRLKLDMNARSRDRDALDSALAKVFILSNRDFVDSVPDYWRPFLLGRVQKDKNGNPELPDWPSQQDLAVNREQPFLNASNAAKGTGDATLRHSVVPHYPEAGRKFGLAGQVVFQGMIGMDGKLHQLAVIKPMGAGFEEQALLALQQWVYNPATVDGRPVAVRTTISLNFKMQ